MATTADTARRPGNRALPRAGLVGGAVLICLAVALLVGARYGLLLLIGLGFGIVLEGFRFGFAGPWRRTIRERDPTGTVAQLVAIGLVALAAFPLLATHGQELIGAHAPVGFAMIGGAFVFGACMQVVMGCGSGTLVNAGSGNPVSLLALPFFAIGSFFGADHLLWWTSLGTAPTVVFSGTLGLLITLAALASVAAFLMWRAAPEQRK
ncbi:YeeE/YedE thiosulfate transporter family protein, partial [Roseivivax halodurans]|uniref:YeeE/YedE thiosulfate transporter family protein n=1 Tax=Roseivivax halodurans TaxID=93683 RepID=UPI0005690287